MGLFSRKKEVVEPTDLAHPLLQLQNADKDRPDVRDVWRLEDAVRGVQIFGGIGSGKTSGSGRELALAYLQNGYGGIVLCGKVDEKDNWLQYAKETNRLDDVIVFEPHGPYTFNPLQYEMNRSKDEGGGHTANIVSLFLSLVKMGNRLEGGSEGLGGREPFWILALKRGKTLGIDLLRQAKLGKQLVGGQSGSEFDLTVVNISKLFRDMPIGQGHSADTLICHCYQVTASAIRRAIDEGDAELVEEVSRMTSAGAGCGSCQCRIQRLLAGLPAECGSCALCPGCGFVKTLCHCQAA